MSQFPPVKSIVYPHPVDPDVCLIEFSNIFHEYQKSNKVKFKSKPLPISIDDTPSYLYVYPCNECGNIAISCTLKDIKLATFSTEVTYFSESADCTYYISKTNVRRFQNHTMLIFLTRKHTTVNYQVILDFVEKETDFSDKGAKLSLHQPSLHDCSITCTISNSGMNEIIGVAKYILMLRSPVFAAMLTSGMSESSNNTVAIGDFQAKTVKKMVEFLYTDECSIDDCTEAMDLFLIADKYEITELKRNVELHLMRNIQVDKSNILELWDIATQFQLEFLTLEVFDFVKNNMKEILKDTVSFQQIFEVLGRDLVLYLTDMHQMVVIDLVRINNDFSIFTNQLQCTCIYYFIYK